MRRHLGALLIGVHRALVALYHAVVDAVFDVSTLVLLAEKSFMVGLVFREEQRYLAFAGEGQSHPIADALPQRRWCLRWP